MNANNRFYLIKEKLLDHLRWILKRYEEKTKKHYRWIISVLPLKSKWRPPIDGFEVSLWPIQSLNDLRLQSYFIYRTPIATSRLNVTILHKTPGISPCLQLICATRKKKPLLLCNI